MHALKWLDRTIEYSFYGIFLLVPLVFAGDTSELFELNKMWITWGFAIIIGVAWISKMILAKKIFIQRTPLDIPILLFLAAHIISTLISLDSFVSFWGYYSRWNGGLLSIFTYIFLYYAFVTNLNLKHVLWSIYVMLISGILVGLWGLPSHYGYDPTCLVFRGTLDTSCWTNDFKPTIRTFSTLGQPAWLAAFMASLLPLAMAYYIRATSLENSSTSKKIYLIVGYLSLVILFYLNLIFAHTRGGLYAFWAADIIFWVAIFYKKLFTKKHFLVSLLIIHGTFLVSHFFLGSEIQSLNKFTLPGMMETQAPAAAPATPSTPAAPAAAQTAAAAQTPPEPAPAQSGITDSGQIRLNVWKGAVDAWKSSPLFGTGVETFAFAFYKYKPVEHNLTSEWDFLYNKAHNEYLNYLTTTGLFGIVSYLAFILLFTLAVGKWLLMHNREKHDKHYNHDITYEQSNLLIISLFAGWVSILISNFFGFSVVIMNIFLFMFPLFAYMLADKIDYEKVLSIGSTEHVSKHISAVQWTGISIAAIIGCFLSYQLLVYRNADIAYALGYNYDKVGEAQKAYPLLAEAVKEVPSEPEYKDKLAVNLATLAAAMAQQKESAPAANEAIKNAVDMSNQVTTEHPNNVTYWKNRVRIFYTLAQIDPTNQGVYLREAAAAIAKAAELAPTDAKVLYNLGVLYGQTGNLQKGIEILESTAKMKPNYRDALFALGLFYHEQGVDKDGKIVNRESLQKAIETYEKILTMSPNDKQVQETLKTWKNK